MFDVEKLPQELKIAWNNDHAQPEIEDLWKIAEKFDELLQGGWLAETHQCIECDANVTDERGHYEDCKIGKAIHAIRRLMYEDK